ncbi:hypothetical protein Z042_15910 [Chania multitudinisentens RB-25]|uniref:Uncharacterized protein n=1 Tax=Chania multitudinisentens RB-25 TaxID=1441930 RepID=W0LG62_9GAMM|nr:YhfX family PLP-dependent enzyme [Chania multitudinisentens]AHG20920.1 hypothetical protein Z042_15910 [Chania multitudinisentens RB-25]
MFLSALQKQNPALIEAAVALWQQGKVLPDTYLIDLDQLWENARLLLAVAKQYGLKLYAMPKQIGHNPYICQKLLDMGFAGIVAVDFKEANQLYRHRVPVAHIGHLVQPPLHLLPKILAEKPEVITVYSLEKAQQISAVAAQQNYTQPLLLKVYQPGDVLYPGQEAGFALDQLVDAIAHIQQLPNVRIVGATHFPCMLFDQARQETLATPNLATLLAGKAMIEQQGVPVEQLNAPSASSCATFPLLAEHGVTHAEPGHALTGTIPANQTGDQPERIAMLYLSEISHHFAGNSYFFGGGYYRRGHLQQALVFTGGKAQWAEVLPTDDSSIDYCLRLAGQWPIGNPVISCFRTQIFVTRSDVALVAGIQSGSPQLVATYDSFGRRYE